MNSKINPPAFPCTGENYNHPDWSSEGMTLRDYFAAQAMQGIQSRVNWDIKAIAVLAYDQADAMLKAREQ